MDYFVNDITLLVDDIQKNHGFDYDIEEVVYTEFVDFFHVSSEEIFYAIIDEERMELIRALESSSSEQIILTDTMSLLTVDDVKFLLVDFVDICILLVDKVKKEDLNNLINSLI